MSLICTEAIEDGYCHYFHFREKHNHLCQVCSPQSQTDPQEYSSANLRRYPRETWPCTESQEPRSGCGSAPALPLLTATCKSRTLFSTVSYPYRLPPSQKKGQVKSHCHSHHSSIWNLLVAQEWGVKRSGENVFPFLPKSNPIAHQHP